jgi:hypothetical protein
MGYSKYILSLFVFSSFFINGKDYKGAEFRTIESFLYGRFEVSYKPANREGVVSSFFTYHDFTPQTSWNEIDLEFIGRYSNSIQFNTITPGQRFHIRSQHIDFDPYIDFHEYAFEWTPDYVAWFIDGTEVYRQTGDHIKTLQYPQKIMMNIWNPVYTNWVGYWKDEYLPAVSIYDWVQYSSFTPDSGNYGTDNNFTIQWKDDFNSYNDSMWTKAAHTFAGNLADFEPNNIIFENGKLKLFLTNQTDIGGIDKIPPKIIWSRANYDSSISIKFSEELSNESAENIENYILTGGKINQAILNPNEVYVTLITSGYNPYLSNNLIYKNIKDKSLSGNPSPLSVSNIKQLDQIIFPIKINIGGPELEGYKADQEWSSTTNYGYWMGDKKNWPEDLIINGTSNPQIFLTERKGLINYFFKVPNGRYKVVLFFSENDNNGNGDRVFNVYAQNRLFAGNIDVFESAGKNFVYSIENELDVIDEFIMLHFEESIDSAFVNAIIVEKIVTSVNGENKSNVVDQFELYQNYPNPFNSSTKIAYNLPNASNVELKIFDVLGKQIFIENKISQSKGNHSFYWNGFTTEGEELTSGVYIYQINAGGMVTSKKLIYLK